MAETTESALGRTPCWLVPGTGNENGKLSKCNVNLTAPLAPAPPRVRLGASHDGFERDEC
jgi:hypothetical protein